VVLRETKSNSKHHQTNQNVSVLYNEFFTQKQTHSMYHAYRTVHFLFISTQEQHHQTPGNAGSCQSILQIIFSNTTMQIHPVLTL
jgi:hypothetical protein